MFFTQQNKKGEKDATNIEKLNLIKRQNVLLDLEVKLHEWESSLEKRGNTHDSN